MAPLAQLASSALVQLSTSWALLASGSAGRSGPAGRPGLQCFGHAINVRSSALSIALSDALSNAPWCSLSRALSRDLSCYPGLQSNSMLGVAGRSGSAGLALSCAVPCALSCSLISDLCCALSTVLTTASIAVLDIKASATLQCFL